MASQPLPISVNEVIPGQVWIGNLGAARTLHTTPLNTLGITHVLSVCPDELSNDASHHLCIPVEDDERADLLIHLPAACAFIRDALAAHGRVLVHCVMGVSRSATVVAAYLMQTQHLSPAEAIAHIRRHRPAVRPNYGFIRQLHAFAECEHAPSAVHPAYKAWRRRAAREVAPLLSALGDAASLARGAVVLGGALPGDPELADAIVGELGATHVLSVVPGRKEPARLLCAQQRSMRGETSDGLIAELPGAVRWMCAAGEGGGVVYVASAQESTACVIAGAYLIAAQTISPAEATQQLIEALPLWEPTRSFIETLGRFAALDPAPPPRNDELQAVSTAPDSAPPPLGDELQAVSAALSQLHLPVPTPPAKPPRARPRGATITGRGVHTLLATAVG